MSGANKHIEQLGVSVELTNDYLLITPKLIKTNNTCMDK